MSGGSSYQSLKEALQSDDPSAFSESIKQVTCLSSDELKDLLIAAVQTNHIEAAKLLLDKNADPNTSPSNVLPLAIAVNEGRNELVTLLLNHNADPNAKSGDDNLPLLFHALVNPKLELVEQLLAFGADPETNINGKTPLSYLRETGITAFDVEDMLAEASGTRPKSRAGSLTNIPLPILVRQYTKRGDCSYLATKDQFTRQRWWFCSTCSDQAGQDVGCCEACKRRCHKGHDLQDQPIDLFYCDCGSSLSTCQALKPQTKEELGASPEGLAKYRAALSAALFDQEVSEAEDRILTKLRRELNVTEEQHEAELKALSYTKDQFLKMHVKANVASNEPDPDRMLITGKEALLIGNSAYVQKDAVLKNPANDVKTMKKVLESLGFNVVCKVDLMTGEEIQDCVREFGKRLEEKYERKGDGGCVSLFMFAGHAIEINGTNYLLHCGYTNDDLISKGLTPATVFENPLSGYVSMQMVLATIEPVCNTNILIMDCCRNNPFAAALRAKPASKIKKTGRQSKSSEKEEKDKGLAAIYPSGSSFVMLAAAPGFTAADGGKDRPDNGLFTGILVNHLSKRDLHIAEVMYRTSRDVYLASDGMQHPWSHSGLLKRVYLGADLYTPNESN